MRLSLPVMLVGAAMLFGCAHPPEITSVPASRWNQCEPAGMPFYLPKPLLVVSKNVRHIDEAKVGLTQPVPIPNAFDDQAGYADLKANVTSPGEAGSDTLPAADTGGIARSDKFDEAKLGLPTGWRGDMVPKGRVKDTLRPDSFYTYQIMFVPDLSQKYGLRIKGQPGEVRATMNMVNGWMYTGMGPYYLKDSSTAQNIMSIGVASLFAGRGASDVLDSVAGLASAATPTAAPGQERAPLEGDEFIERATKLARVIQSQTLIPREMMNYAEISIYEPCLNEVGETNWTLIAHHNMNRQYFSPDMDKNAADLLRQLIVPGKRADSEPGAAIETNSEDPTIDAPETLPGGGPGANLETVPRPTLDAFPEGAESDRFPPIVNPDGSSVILPARRAVGTPTMRLPTQPTANRFPVPLR